MQTEYEGVLNLISAAKNSGEIKKVSSVRKCVTLSNDNTILCLKADIDRSFCSKLQHLGVLNFPNRVACSLFS